MSHHVIAGAGTVGTLIAQKLTERGISCVLVSRTTRDSTIPGVEHATADVADTDALLELCRGADALYNCINPPYDCWPTLWPQLHESFLLAAGSSGAVLCTLGNVYAYGRVDAPMTPDMPTKARFINGRVRADMWSSAHTAHEAGRVRATEVRASNFIGPRAQSAIGASVIPALLRGERPMVRGRADRLHSFTYVDDIAHTMIECATNPRAWGRPWHAPNNPPVTQQDVLDAVADAAGVPRRRARTEPGWLNYLRSRRTPVSREMRKIRFHFTDDFIVDDGATRRELECHPTAWTEVIRKTADWYRITYGS